MNLSDRLSIALNYVPIGSNVIDVGADRGFLSLELARRGFKVLAIENKKGPYLNLKKNVDEENNDNLKCHLSDGIEYLPKEYNCALLLGMGGATIHKILSKDIKKLQQLKTIIIEPQSMISLPILFLLEQGYVNDLGCYVYEKRHYPLLRFVKTNEKIEYNSLEKKYGPYPVGKKDKLLIEYLQKECARLQQYGPEHEKYAEFKADLDQLMEE